MPLLNFDWKPHEEDIVILGKKGEGKTERCRRILNSIPNRPRLIWSPQRPTENFAGYGEFVNKIEDLKKGAYVWNGAYDKKTFAKFCNKAMELKNIIVVVDDVHEYVNKQFMQPEFETLVLSGRNQGISGIYLSPLPSKVNNDILGNAAHIFCYKLNLQTHIEWLRDNFFGTDAWLLVPKDKRNKFFVSDSDYDILPDYSFLYRKDSDSVNELVINGEVVQIGLKPSEDTEEDSESIRNSPESDSDSVSRGEMSEEIRLGESPEHTSRPETPSELQD